MDEPRMQGGSGSRRGSGNLAALEALPAENGATLGGAEGNCGLTPALRTDSRGLNAAGWSAPFRGAALTLRLTGSAALGLVPEIFFVVKLLFARGKYEICSAVDTFESPVLKFSHGTILGGRRSACHSLRRCLLFDFAAALLPVSFPGKSSLDPFFLSRLQIERMPFNLFNDVFLLHFSFEASKGVF